MGKHSAGSGSRNPFNRKHEHLGHSSGTRRGRPLRSLETSSKATGERLTDTRSRRQGPLEAAPARLKAERDRRRARYKKIASIAAIAAVVLVAVGVVSALAYVRWVEKTMSPDVEVRKIVETLDKAKPQKPFNLLLIGADKRPRETVARADTMILARVDPKAKKIWMLSIPRDTRVDIPGHGSAKINQAYALGGPEGAISAVKELTGVPIHHYVQVDFKGFVQAVDVLGGVWIDVPVEIDDWAASSHSYKHRAAHIDAGYQLLDGEHALTFARARHQFVDQDFSRMKNQQLFFKALADQAAKPQSLYKIPRLVSGIAPYVQTDMKLMEMVRTAQALRDAGSKNLYTATVTGEWKSPYIYHDEEKLELLVERMKAGVSFDTTVTPKAPAGGTSTSAKDPSDVTVTVRNGGGVSGCAKQASSILKARAFQVPEVGNANQFVYKETLVVYKSDRGAAEMVASVLPPGTKLVESRGMYSFKTDVLVVIGKDWDLAKVPVTPVKTN